MSGPSTPEWRARVVPKRSLLRNGLLSLVLITAPLFGALYFLSIPLGTWPGVLVAHLASLVLAVFAFIRFQLTFIGVTPEHLVERGFLAPTRSIPVTSVATVVLVETYQANTPETTPQLLVSDGDGRRMLRMRGVFWSEENMRIIAAAIDQPLQYYPHPITIREFFRTYPSSAYWFENRPSIVVLAIFVTFALCLGVVLGLMALSGIPIG